MTRILKQVNPAVAGASLMVIAGALFALVNTLVQYGAMVQGISTTRLAFWQYFLAFVFALPWLLFKRRAAFRTAHLPLHLLRVGLAAGGVQLWVMGLAHVPIWQAISLIMLSPFFVTLGAGIVLREATTVERWAAVSVGFLGGMVVLAPWSEDFTLFALLPVGAAALWAFASLLTKHMTKTESPESLTVYLLLLLTPINGVLAWGDGVAFGANSFHMLLIALGVLTALAQYALVKAYSLVDAAYLQPFDHIKMPFNVLLGIVVFGFIPPGSLWIGSVLIIGASFFLLKQETKVAPA